MTSSLSKERSCAEALMMACDERLGAQSPAALMVCDTFLARDFWTSFVHQSFPPPAASQVWAWGTNGFGHLGLGDTKERTTPTEVASLHGRRIRAVACFSHHSAAVVDDGELWTAGWNDFGQLGLGLACSRTAFTRVAALSGRKVVAVACGGIHTLALLESGELLSCGYNGYGECGLGHEEITRTPEPVAALSGRRVVAIACGEPFSVAVLDTGELFAWGRNSHGQLGLGDVSIRKVPTQVTALAGRRVVTVACGVVHTAAVLESGELFTWGNNERGQLGIGDRAHRSTPQLVQAFHGRKVKSVVCGFFHTFALLDEGELFAWGFNDRGQLGVGGGSSNTPITSPQQVHFFDGKCIRSVHGGDLSSVVLEDDTLFVWGRGESTPKPFLEDKRIVSAAHGSRFDMFLVV